MDGLGVGSAEAVLVSAFVGGVVALAVVRRHRTIAKKAKAYEVAEQFFRRERLEAEAKLREMAKTKNWETIIGSEEQVEAETRQQVIRCLNEWELMCVGIRQNIVHEGVLKDAIGDRLVIIHMAADGLIAEIRREQGDKEFYEHFEYIARKWTANPRNLWRGVREWISWKMGRGGR